MWNEMQLQTVQHEIIKLYRLAYYLLPVPQGHKSASENAPIFIDVCYSIYKFFNKHNMPYSMLPLCGTLRMVCVT